MGRPRTIHPVVLCQRLSVGEIAVLLANLEGKAPVLISLRRTPEVWPFLLAVRPLRPAGTLRGVILAYRSEGYEAPGVLVRQEVALRRETDVTGRSRTRFVCPGFGCGRSADSLYLPPEADQLQCRRCTGISYRRQPSLPGCDLPSWSGEMEGMLRGCRALAREMVCRSNERPSGRRHRHRGEDMDDINRADPRALRQRAVADLWRERGWTVVELSRLFGVSDRTIKRDLRAAREQGEAPPRRRRIPLGELREQMADLLGRFRTLQESLLEMAQAGGESEGRRTWAAATQARLLCEQRRLVELLAVLEGARRPRRREQGLRQEPAWLDPELLARAAEAVAGSG